MEYEGTQIAANGQRLSSNNLTWPDKLRVLADELGMEDWAIEWDEEFSTYNLIPPAGTIVALDPSGDVVGAASVNTPEEDG